MCDSCLFMSYIKQKNLCIVRYAHTRMFCVVRVVYKHLRSEEDQGGDVEREVEAKGV